MHEKEIEKLQAEKENNTSEDGSSTSTVEVRVSLKLIKLLRFPVSSSKSAHLSSFFVSTARSPPPFSY